MYTKLEKNSEVTPSKLSDTEKHLELHGGELLTLGTQLGVMMVSSKSKLEIVELILNAMLVSREKK